MTSPASYLAPSAVLPWGSGRVVGLETARGLTPDGLVEHPDFFNGLLSRPDVIATGLLAVARVAGTRYSIDLAELRRNLDPVVTAGGDRLRFESFSECNGVHARLDVLGDGLDSGEMSFGTTNVDINQPLRGALGRMRSSDLVHLAVGAEALRVSSLDETHEERRVDMPNRWVRGLAETPWLARGMDHRATLDKAGLVPFLNGLSRTGSGQTFHLVPTPNGLRMSASPTRRSILLAGTGRLAVLTSIARFATRLDVYAHPGGSSGWVVHLPHARMTLLLSPGAHRGFSGEGSVLVPLSHPKAETVGRSLLDHLSAWEPLVDPDGLARVSGHDRGNVDAGLCVALRRPAGSASTSRPARWSQTASRRWTPTGSCATTRGYARAARITGIERVGDAWRVPGEHAVYTVIDTGERWQCTCPWEHEHHGTRGPCKHVLAVVLAAAPGGTP